MRLKFSQLDSIALTLDIWTEQFNTIGYLGITIHCLSDENHEMRSNILGVLELSDHYTADYLVDCLDKVLVEWQISKEKVAACITDGGANVVAACKKYFGESKHLICYAHLLNNIVTTALNDEKNSMLGSSIQKLKRIVTWFYQSVVAADELPKTTDLKLIQFVATRWNSTSHMIERYLKISDKVTNILLRTKSPDMLTSEEQELFQEVVSCLLIFDEITKKVSSEKVVTISNIIPYSRHIVNTLEKKEISTLSGKLLQIKLKDLAKEKFSPLEFNSIASCSVILDPRFKKVHFSNTKACIKAVEWIKRMMPVKSVFITETVTQQIPTENEDDGFQQFNNAILEENYIVASSVSISDDISKYLRSPNVNGKVDPLIFWMKHKHLYPALFKVAKQLLYILATSISSERMFSLCGLIMTAKRNKMSPEHLNRLLFLYTFNYDEWTSS